MDCMACAQVPLQDQEYLDPVFPSDFRPYCAVHWPSHWSLSRRCCWPHGKRWVPPDGYRACY